MKLKLLYSKTKNQCPPSVCWFKKAQSQKSEGDHGSDLNLDDHMKFIIKAANYYQVH